MAAPVRKILDQPMYYVLSGCNDVTEALKLQADLMALLVLGFH
jgi:hypothetical protein